MRKEKLNPYLVTSFPNGYLFQRRNEKVFLKHNTVFKNFLANNHKKTDFVPKQNLDVRVFEVGERNINIILGRRRITTKIEDFNINLYINNMKVKTMLATWNSSVDLINFLVSHLSLEDRSYRK